MDCYDPSDRWDTDRERPVPNTDHTGEVPHPADDGKETQQ